MNYRFTAKRFEVAFQGLLGFAIFLQLAYLGLFLGGPYYKLPAFFEPKITATLKAHGYNLEAESIEIGTDLCLLIKNVQITQNEASGSVFTAQRIKIGLQRLPLLVGKLGLRNLKIHNATYVASSKNEPWIYNLYANLQNKGRCWNIREAQAICFHTPIVAYGSLCIDEIFKNPSHTLTFSEIENLNRYLGHLDKPRITAKFKSTKSEPLSCQINIFANALHVNDCYFATPYIRTHWAFDSVKGTLLPKKISLIAEKCEAQPWDIHTQKTHLLALFSKQESLTLTFPFNLESIQGQSFNIQTPYATVDTGITTIAVLSSDAYTAQSLLSQGASFVELMARYNHTKQATIFDLSGTIKPKTLEAIPHQKIELLQGFSKKPSLRFSCCGECEHGFQLKKATFSARASHGQWNEIVFEKVTIAGGYSPEHLNLHHWSVEGPLAHIAGNAAYDFSGHCRIQLEGTGSPSLLDAYLPNWWAPIWPPLNFEPGLPWANLDIQAHKNDPTQVLVIGAIQGKNFTYKGVALDYFHTGLYARHFHVHLGTFEAKIGKKQGSGSVTWTFDETQDSPLSTAIEYQGDLPLQAIAVLPPIDTIVEPFDCPTPPFIQLKGINYLLTPEKNDLVLSGDCPAPLSYHKIPLDSLHFKAQESGTFLSINPINFGLARGQGEASATISPVGADNPTLSLSFTLRGAKRDIFIDTIPYLSDLKNAANSGSDYASDFLDFSFSGEGPLYNPIEMNGQGLLELKGSVIQFGKQVKSQLLSIGDFEIKTALIPFYLKQGLVEFNAARFSGPTSRIIVTGNYNLKTEMMDLKVQLFPFSEIPILSTAFLPLRPFSKVFEMRINGSLNDPHWNFNNLPSADLKK